MNTGPISMRQLLEYAGFAVRGANRADCVHCEGHSRGTVAFTSEVAFCHRCKWRANVITLARGVGLFQSDSHTTAATRAKVRHRQHLELQVQQFELWREGQIHSISDRYRRLWSAAGRAVQVLLKFPECEAAWCALAQFYQAEAHLSAIFDWLMFIKASIWLDADSTPTEVYETWRRYAA
jgi:hypothetical protein